VDRRVYAQRGQLDVAFALERFARFVEHDHVARARLRPVQAERQNQVLVVAPRHGDREVVVDALLEVVEHGEAMRRSELDFRLRDRIDCARGRQGVDGHDGPLSDGVRAL
jgi:hypothetical protein